MLIRRGRVHRLAGHEVVEQLLKAGGLSLAALTMPRLASKAYGLVEQPLVGWDLVPLRVPGSSYAVDASEVARRFEEVGTRLPQSWAALDAWAQAERNENEVA
jgi:hypothetical protein